MISGNVSSAGISAVTEGRECYDDKIAELKTRGLGLLKGVQHFYPPCRQSMLQILFKSFLDFIFRASVPEKRLDCVTARESNDANFEW